MNVNDPFYDIISISDIVITRSEDTYTTTYSAFVITFMAPIYEVTKNDELLHHVSTFILDAWGITSVTTVGLNSTVISNEHVVLTTLKLLFTASYENHPLNELRLMYSLVWRIH